jgi:malate dehydrogenase
MTSRLISGIRRAFPFRANMTRKVSVFGAGYVGAETAMRIAEKNIADVVLVDIVDGFPRGKALDIQQSCPIVGSDRKIYGTKDPAAIKDSDVIVITAGLARKPGMSRDDLQAKNAGIVSGIIENIRKFAPGSIIVTITNPLDVMTYHAWKVSGFERYKVFGMAGLLDTARMITFISEETGIRASKIKAMVLGGHGDLMVPLVSRTTVNGKPLRSSLPNFKIENVFRRTASGGIEIVNLLQNGSAYYAPAAATARMVEAVLTNSGEVIPCSVIPDGEYGLGEDVCIGLPAKIGKHGVEKIVEINLTPEENAMLMKSAASVKESIAKL